MVFADATEALMWIVRLAAIGVLTVSLETLVQRRVLRDENLMSWRVGSLRQVYLVRPPFGRWLDLVLGYPNVCGMLVLRGLLAAVLAAGPRALVLSPWCLSAMALMLLLFTVRNPYGHDGADQMAIIIFTSAAMATLAGGWAVKACLWFLGLQICLAYSTAGIAKATARGWLDGSYLVGIAASQMYGHQEAALFLSREPLISRVLSISIFTWESLFPLVLVAPRPVAYAMVASGFLFHLSNGFLMGLNDFLWLFVATYPALLYCIAARGF